MRTVAETSLSVTYDGPAIATGRMDVHDLAPALLALADLFRESSRLLNPDAPPVRMQIEATTRGSFEVHLLLVQPELVDRFVEFFTGNQFDALDNLKKWIIAPGAGLFWYIIKRRNRKVSARKVQGKQVVVTFEDGTSITVPEQTDRLHDSIEIRRRTREVVQPLEREGVEFVRFRAEATALSVGREELSAFEVPPAVPEPLLEHDTEMFLAIAEVQFIRGNKWRLSDGTSNFHAAMADEAFLDRVDAGAKFSKGDFLHCRVRIEQARKEGKLTTEYTILDVLEHLPRREAQQASLFDNLGRVDDMPDDSNNHLDGDSPEESG